MTDCCSGYPNCVHNMPQRMTDLERVAWAALKGDITSWPAQIVSALAAARREGAEEMRERAAQHCDEPAKRLREELGWSAEAELLERYAAAIRALPLTPGEPLSRDKSDEE